MLRLTSYETAQADLHDTGVASFDEAAEAAEAAGLRAGRDLIETIR